MMLDEEYKDVGASKHKVLRGRGQLALSYWKEWSFTSEDATVDRGSEWLEILIRTKPAT